MPDKILLMYLFKPYRKVVLQPTEMLQTMTNSSIPMSASEVANIGLNELGLQPVEIVEIEDPETGTHY